MLLHLSNYATSNAAFVGLSPALDEARSLLRDIKAVDFRDNDIKVENEGVENVFGALIEGLLF